MAGTVMLFLDDKQAALLIETLRLEAHVSLPGPRRDELAALHAEIVRQRDAQRDE